MMVMNLLKSVTLIPLICLSVSTQANSLDQAKAVEHKTIAAAAASQKKIDHSATSSLALQSEIDLLKEEIKNTTIYRDHLAALIANQEQEMGSLEQQIADINQTRQGIVPLMYHMLEGLENLIEQDKPLRLTARQERLAKLQALMPRADVSEAEKYRRILEAYQIEMDYGIKLGSYQDRITLVDGDEVEADLVYLGRAALIARNLNATQYWSWDQQQQSWVALGSEYKSNLDTAYRLAAQQIAPTLLTLPVSLTQGAK